LIDLLQGILEPYERPAQEGSPLLDGYSEGIYPKVYQKTVFEKNLHELKNRLNTFVQNNHNIFQIWQYQFAFD